MERRGMKEKVSLDYLLLTLVEMGMVAQNQVDSATAAAKVDEKGVVDWLVGQKLLTEWQVAQARAAHFGAEVIEDDKVVVARNWRKRLPRSVGARFFKEHQVVPIQINSAGGRGVCRVAMNDLSDLDTIDLLNHLIRMNIVVLVASRPAIRSALAKMRDRAGR